MEAKHLFLVIFVMICFGSVYPLGKLGTNNIPPILFSSLRVLIIFIGILPFFKIKLPSKKLILPLLIFSISMGIGVYVSLYIALDISSLVSPIIIGTQLTVPFGLILSFIFLNEKPDQKTLLAILITTLAVIYIFYDSFDRGDSFGNFFGLLAAMGLATGAVIIRSAKKINLIPSAMVGKLLISLFAIIFVDNLVLKGNDLLIVPLMCVMCVAIPFVLITLAPRYITAAEVNLFFLLETILGPLWVWLVIKEQPSIETIVGGFIIIITITVHSILSLKKI